jgi:hypothetical protein
MGMHHLLLALFLPIAALHASGAGKGYAAQSSSPTPSSEVINQPLSAFELKGSNREIFRRVLQTRLYHKGVWTLSDPSQTPVTAARTIASLKPTFVTGLLRIPDRGSLSNAEVDAFHAVRTAVLASAKGCRFDIVLNAGVEQSGDLVVRRMKEISYARYFLGPNLEYPAAPLPTEASLAAAGLRLKSPMIAFRLDSGWKALAVEAVVAKVESERRHRFTVDGVELECHVPAGPAVAARGSSSSVAAAQRWWLPCSYFGRAIACG